MHRRRSAFVQLVVLVVAFGLFASTVLAADPSPSTPRTVRFEAATHVGYRFSSTWVVVGTKTATLPRASSATATARRAIPNRGVHLYISNGIWAGYYIPESALAYVPGTVGAVTYSPVRYVSFAAGTYLGYRFTSSGALSTTRRATLPRASSAHAGSAAVINGLSYQGIVDGIWAGYWMPVSAGRPAAIDCRAGNRVAAGSQQSFTSIPNATGEMALTFDMGGRLDPAVDILRYLVVQRVCATIFPTGEAAQTAIGQQVLALIRGHPELFEVGNHTQHHCDLVDGAQSRGDPDCPASRPSNTFIANELTTAGTIIAAGSGQSPKPYWRPPYGDVDAGVRTVAASVGYTKTFLWSIDTIDWREQALGGPTAYQIEEKVVSRAASGSIVLMHLGGWNTRNALPAMITRLRARAYTLGSLSDLLDGL